MTLEELIKELERAEFGHAGLDVKISNTLNHDPMSPRIDYTTCLDNAVRMVPRGWHWGISSIDEGDIFSDGGFQAYVTPSLKDYVGYQHGEAKTAPLAILVASLKIKAEGNSHG